MRVGVVGLGKLGLPLAETLAERQEVLGYDIAPRESDSVRVVPTLAAAVDGCEIVFVVLPTPHDRDYDGSRPATHLPPRDFTHDHVRETLEALDEVVAADTVVALVSTVLPGTIRRELAPAVTRAELVYTPAFMAMGRVRQDFLEPEFRLLGSSDGDPGAGEAVQALWQSFGDECPVHLVTWEEAEAIKIFYNVFVSFKLAFVNTIQDVAERTGHADVDVVTDALLTGRRRLLSPMYMRAGLGDGGPCHPRDLIALRFLSERLELGYDLFGAIAATREAQARNLAAALASHELPVLITSRSFKPGVPYDDGSPSLLVAHYVEELGVPVRFLDELGAAPDEPHAVLLAHDIDHSGLVLPPGSVVVDPWRRYVNPELRVVHYGARRTPAPRTT